MKAEIVKELNSSRRFGGWGERWGVREAGKQGEIKSMIKSQELAVQLVSRRQGALLFHCWSLRPNSLNHSADLNYINFT